MREEMLSPAELESLLERDDDARPAAKPRFELPRMQRLARHQLATVRQLHREAAGALEATFRELFRTSAAIDCVRIDQPRREQLLDELDSTSCGYPLQISPLEARWEMYIPSSLALAMIDRLLGGGKEAQPVVHRPLTEIERRLLKRVVAPFAQWLQAAWTPVAKLTVSAAEETEETKGEASVEAVAGASSRSAGTGAAEKTVECNAVADEPLVRIRLPLTLGTVSGEILLALPCASLEPLHRALTVPPPAEAWSANAAAVDAAGEDATAVAGSARQGSVELTVLLTDSRLQAAAFEQLEVGDLITTDHPVGEPLLVCLDGRPAFRAALGSQSDRRAVRILREAEPD
jgi:flagellar motor switch protein FliM